MLKRFRVNNVKNLLNVEFRPVGLNLLIGQNNAGKTNLCSAIVFMGLSSGLKLDVAAAAAFREIWNLPNVYVSDSAVEMEADCQLSREGHLIDFNYQLQIAVRKELHTGKTLLEVESERLVITGAGFGQTPILENRAGRARLLREGSMPEQSGSPDSQVYAETLVSTDATMLSRLDMEAHSLARLFKNYLSSWSYFSFVSTMLRSFKISTPPGRWIAPDGANFGYMLFLAHNENPRLERQIVEMVRMIEPKLDVLTYFSPDPESVFLFLEDEKRNRFGMQSISDGTLRLMAMAYVILAATEHDPNQPAPLIMIEEPENGLYVGHLKPLLEQIDLSGRYGQFIFTSHSPYFIDLFDNNLEGLHLMKPGRPSSVLTKPDPDRTRKLLEQMPLGEMHFREMLG